MKLSWRTIKTDEDILLFRVVVVSLGFFDMVKLVLGRELAITGTRIHYEHAYEAFNLSATRAPDVEVAGSAPEPRDRA
jgi:hypothetical protein